MNKGKRREANGEIFVSNEAKSEKKICLLRTVHSESVEYVTFYPHNECLRGSFHALYLQLFENNTFILFFMGLGVHCLRFTVAPMLVWRLCKVKEGLWARTDLRFSHWDQEVATKLSFLKFIWNTCRWYHETCYKDFTYELQGMLKSGRINWYQWHFEGPSAMEFLKLRTEYHKAFLLSSVKFFWTLGIRQSWSSYS